MYKWNKKELKQLIEDLKKKTPKNEEDKQEIEYCINKLYELISKHSTQINNFEEENEEYKELEQYDSLINPILNKYITTQDKYSTHKLLFKTKKEILTTTKEIINNINPKWYNLLSNLFNNQNLLDFKHGNENELFLLDYINRIYISLDKKNNIEDYLCSIHEYLHALTILLNPSFLYNIECEFLSILGELIMSYEMKKINFYPKEFLKSENNTYCYILESLHSIIFKRNTINSNIQSENKIEYLNKEFLIPKSIILDMYNSSLTYNYSNGISYFLAIELFEIYKVDKDKFIHICESIITDNAPLTNKLSKHNIHLLQHSNKYIKTLKKEFKN